MKLDPFVDGNFTTPYIIMGRSYWIWLRILCFVDLRPGLGGIIWIFRYHGDPCSDVSVYIMFVYINILLTDAVAIVEAEWRINGSAI